MKGWFSTSTSTPVGKISISWGTMGVCASFQGLSSCSDYKSIESLMSGGGGDASDTFKKISTESASTRLR